MIILILTLSCISTAEINIDNELHGKKLNNFVEDLFSIKQPAKATPKNTKQQPNSTPKSALDYDDIDFLQTSIKTNLRQSNKAAPTIKSNYFNL